MTESKVAVITGAGSGIGRGLAQFAASKRMQLVLCDVNADGLDETLDIVTAEGVEAIARVIDVSDINAMMNLASETYETFSACNYLFISTWEDALMESMHFFLECLKVAKRVILLQLVPHQDL